MKAFGHLCFVRFSPTQTPAITLLGAFELLNPYDLNASGAPAHALACDPFKPVRTT
jgi:hypothetical protein